MRVRHWLSGIVLITAGVALPPQGMAQTESQGDSAPPTLEGLPNFSVKYGSIASSTRASTGVVA